MSWFCKIMYPVPISIPQLRKFFACAGDCHSIWWKVLTLISPTFWMLRKNPFLNAECKKFVSTWVREAAVQVLTQSTWKKKQYFQVLFAHNSFKKQYRWRHLLCYKEVSVYPHCWHYLSTNHTMVVTDLLAQHSFISNVIYKTVHVTGYAWVWGLCRWVSVAEQWPMCVGCRTIFIAFCCVFFWNYWCAISSWQGMFIQIIAHTVFPCLHEWAGVDVCL